MKRTVPMAFGACNAENFRIEQKDVLTESCAAARVVQPFGTLEIRDEDGG